jgi:SAM-dependent methyltransferase
MTDCPHPPSQVAPRFRARDYITGGEFEVSRCGGCGLDLTRPQPDPSAMAAYYPPEYYGRLGARRFPALVELGQRTLYAWRARAVERIAGGHPGLVLDIGCGPGGLLEAFRRRGWDVQGTELNDESAVRARQAGIPVQVGSLDSWDWPAGHFDAVTMWHVLEHWPDPRPVLRRVHQFLRPGGVFMVGVPNFGSPEARAARDGWFHLDVPRHLVHFTEASLRGALAAAGFTVRAQSSVALEFDTFSMVQSALNRTGLKHNLLYNVLRGRHAKVMDAGSGVQVPATLLLAALLAIPALPASILLGIAGQGSSLTVYAVKEPSGTLVTSA